MRRIVIGVMLLALASMELVSAEAAQNVPWWKEHKIQFMWGQWNHARADKSGNWWEADLPREIFRNVAQAGGTVFAELRGYNPNHARLAHEFGMKYFATKFSNDLPRLPGGRNWVKENGEEYRGSPDEPYFKCPMDESVYNLWLVESHLEGVREGLIDGIHTDWEYYSGNGDAKGVCYCDDCFSKFLELKGIKADLPEKANRFTFLRDQGLVKAYEEDFRKRRVEMFTSLAQKMRAINPDLLFSVYAMELFDFARAVNTPRTPLIFLDARHYDNDDRQPWWESYSARLKQEGYLYIPGGWTNALFGAQASQVSAARWIYEAAINEDGCWLWFERVLDDEILRAYAAADREIKAVESAVGDYLFNGEKDYNFVTPVEWTGRPELEQAVITHTYHLGNEHLLHINNVNTDWPLRTRIRFPRLADGKRWMVRDAMSQLYYSGDGKSAVWTTAELHNGVVVAMEPRSDLFLLVSPADAKLKVDTSRLVQSAEFSVLPTHVAVSMQAGPPEAMLSLKDVAEQYAIKNRLVYPEVMKNSIYAKDLEALLGSTQKIFDLPKTGWRFKMDRDDVGVEERWFLPQALLAGWTPIEIGDYWGDKGSTGAGWYRADIDIPTLPAGKRVYLLFGAVDEQLVLWIDGEYAGDYDRNPDVGWDQPFAIDVTRKLTSGKHHLVLRVHNYKFAGGVWKPVSVQAGPAEAVETKPTKLTEVQRVAGSAGRLVFTATEPMGFEGPEGLMTIGNAIRSVDTRSGIGARLRQLRGHLWSPQYSPEGSRIAFVHDAGGRGQIYVMKEDGSDAVNISGNAFCDRSPVWSPDGRKLAFLSDRSGDWDIYVMNADGSGQSRLAGNLGLDRAPGWSPDGKRLAWESYTSGMPNIWACDADGKNSRSLIAPDRPLIQVPYEAGRVLTRFPDNTCYLRNPAWSPDGKQIAAVGLNQVFVLDADGSRMLEALPSMMGLGQLVWSPTGSKKLAGTMRTGPNETERSGIFVVKPGQHDYSLIVDVTPTGPRRGGAQRHGLNTWYSHGSAQPRRVVKTFTSLDWSPDGQTLAFSSDMDPSGAFYVYTISPGGGQPNRLDGTLSAWTNDIMWRPR